MGYTVATHTAAVVMTAAALLFASPAASADEGGQSNIKDAHFPDLMKWVPDSLKRQDKATGRWGTGPIVVNEQHEIYPLAAAWSIKRDDNPYYHSPEVLEAVMKGGDFLISLQKPDGQWVFRKKDGSEWGDIYMPWTYSRWIRAFALVKDAMPSDRREKWEKALLLGFDGISRTAIPKDKVQNIPAHHSMGLYLAGKVFNKPAWCEQAAAYMKRVVEAQDPGGFWTENLGPVVNYNFVYMDAIGTYYGMSGDKVVLPALERGCQFHANFTYPNGRIVETVDERNGASPSVYGANVGFSFSPIGRAYALQQVAIKKKLDQPASAEHAASFFLYGQEGPVGNTPTGLAEHHFTLGNNDAAIERRKQWFLCMSAYHAPVPQIRWILDRQNFFSLYHDGAGLIVGGGNTKMTPLWSTFTAGDTKLLAHKPGDENPDFREPAGLLHVPTDVKLDPKTMTLRPSYGPAQCEVSVKTPDDKTAVITYALTSKSDLPVEAHVTLVPEVKKEWSTASGKKGALGEEPIRLTADETGGWFAHNGWRVTVPPGSTLQWPVLPHDQYVKDGQGKLNEGRIVITLPIGTEPGQRDVAVTVDGVKK
jgi:hypothetical protein